MSTRIALCCVILIAANMHASAHGPQIQLTAEAGKIQTRAMFANEPYNSLQPLTTIYVLPTASISGEWLLRPNSLSDPGGESDLNGPGIAVGYGYDSLNPSARSFKSGDFTVAFTDGLKRWDGVDFADAGATQLRLNKNAKTADTTDTGPFGSATWNVNVTSSNAHSGLAFRFLGVGLSPTSPLPDGVYLLSLEASHGSLTKSDPYFFVIPRAPGVGELEKAIAALAVDKGVAAGAIQRVVPEPGSLGLAGLAMAWLSLWRRPGRIRRDVT